MSDLFNRNWVPESAAALTFGIGRFLTEGDTEFATALLITEVLKGRFSCVVSILSAHSQIKEADIRLLLSTSTVDSVATRIAYGLAGFPDSVYPLFARCVDSVQEVVKVSKTAITPRIASVVLERTLALDEIRDLNLSDDLTSLLRTHSAGGVVEPVAQVSPAPPAAREAQSRADIAPPRFAQVLTQTKALAPHGALARNA